MHDSSIPRRFEALSRATAPFMRFFNESAWSRLPDPPPPDICDFAVGNPHDMPLEAFVETLQRWIQPQNKDWFAYKLNESQPRQVVAESLRKSHGLPFEPEDVFLTNGSFAGLTVALTAVVDPGEEAEIPEDDGVPDPGDSELSGLERDGEGVLHDLVQVLALPEP